MAITVVRKMSAKINFSFLRCCLERSVMWLRSAMPNVSGKDRLASRVGEKRSLRNPCPGGSVI
jgi:hypothetical protein